MFVLLSLIAILILLLPTETTLAAGRPVTSPEAHIGRGMALTELGRYQEALVAFDSATKLDPTNGLPYQGRSCAHSRQERYTEARADLERALELGLPEDLRAERELLLKILAASDETRSAPS